MDGGFSIYFIDRAKIEQILTYMDELLAEFDTHTFSTKMEELSLERIVHMLIESMLDVGNLMIDGFIMRDAGSYEDIVDILIDEKVIPESDEITFKELIGLRSNIIQDYLMIDHDLLKETIYKNKIELNNFSTHILLYLDNELGVAHAFSNK